MDHFGHSDWTFEHSSSPHFDHSADLHPQAFTDTTPSIPSDSVASVLKTLWHHTDLMNGTLSGAQGSSGSLAMSAAGSATGAGKGVPPTLTVGANALTVNEGGSIALPITVSSSSSAHPATVTIAGLASYETLTDTLDHKVFTGDTVTLSAAEVNSGLSLASNYTGSDHPVNTLTVTAAETFGHHTLSTDSQSIVVTDPPASAATKAP